MSRNNIILCGFMGSGKTTIGKLISECLKMDFIDTDDDICLKLNMSINEIFNNYGEKYFRKLEDYEVSLISKYQFKVIASGGGTFLNRENALKLSKSGKIFFLKANIDTIKSRLKGDNKRPLLKNLDDSLLEELFSKRNKLYESTCDIIIDANKSKELVCKDIIRHLKN